MNLIEWNDMQEILNKINVKDCKNHSFLITGATGFMAKYIIKTLMFIVNQYKNSNIHVYALCRNKEKALSIYDEYANTLNFHLIIQDVNDPIIINNNIDYIFHAASISNTRQFTCFPVDVIKANTIGLLNVLEFARVCKAKGVLFFSSGAVYGEIPKKVCEVKEETTYVMDFLNVSNCYAESKRMGENICVSYASQYNIPVRSVRISHTYGPGIDLEDGHVYSDFVKSILSNSSLQIRGSGQDCRTFCYITDAIYAFFLILFKGEDGGTYNMANVNELYTIKELAEILVSEVFPEKKLKLWIKDLKDVPPHKMYMNVDQLVKLGWNPTIGLREGFLRTVNSFVLT